MEIEIGARSRREVRAVSIALFCAARRWGVLCALRCSALRSRGRGGRGKICSFGCLMLLAVCLSVLLGYFLHVYSLTHLLLRYRYLPLPFLSFLRSFLARPITPSVLSPHLQVHYVHTDNADAKPPILRHLPYPALPHHLDILVPQHIAA